MRAGRRSAFLMWLPMLGVLASCGIPTTGVVEAGGPASGVGPTVRVYFVDDGGALRGVDRRIAGLVDPESAVRVLLKGPTREEQAAGLYTVLPPEASLMSRVTVTSRDGRVIIRLSAGSGSGSLAAAQLICTTVAAQRVIAPGADPQAVTVTGPDGLDIRGTGTQCPDGPRA